MEQQQFFASIPASREVVWNVLWAEETYPEWTSVFFPGSYAVTDWQTGSKVLFLNPEGKGMVSEIVENREPEFMSIKHLGFYDNGVEDTSSEKVKDWQGALENYLLTDEAGNTRLTVSMNLPEEMVSKFAETWSKAFEKIKALAAAKNNKVQ